MVRFEVGAKVECHGRNGDLRIHEMKWSGLEEKS